MFRCMWKFTTFVAQAASLLPVVMYKLSHCDDPQLKLELLNTVPELAIAKVNVVICTVAFRRETARQEFQTSPF